MKLNNIFRMDFTGFWRRHGVLLFIFGIVLGGVVGARYFASNETVQVWLGTFLPPHPLNWDYDTLHKLKPGMTKDNVMDALQVQRVDVFSKAEVDGWVKRYANDKETAFHGDVQEIWLIPHARTGISDFALLGFDASNRLSFFHIEEFTLGYPASRLPARH